MDRVETGNYQVGAFRSRALVNRAVGRSVLEETFLPPVIVDAVASPIHPVHSYFILCPSFHVHPTTYSHALSAPLIIASSRPPLHSLSFDYLDLLPCARSRYLLCRNAFAVRVKTYASTRDRGLLPVLLPKPLSLYIR